MLAFKISALACLVVLLASGASALFGSKAQTQSAHPTVMNNIDSTNVNGMNMVNGRDARSSHPTHVYAPADFNQHAHYPAGHQGGYQPHLYQPEHSYGHGHGHNQHQLMGHNPNHAGYGHGYQPAHGVYGQAPIPMVQVPAKRRLFGRKKNPQAMYTPVSQHVSY